ncbi:MAG: PepSY-like domain-containing protein [Bacteroidia bacterium]|nr:PepSY-like domain-containing protein [Bacteroidia bacterium]
MRKLIIFCAFVLSFICAPLFGQSVKENQVPLEVRNSFKDKYPNVYVYEWEWVKKKNYYEAEFIMRGNEYDAYFNPDGTWVFTKREIKNSNLPEPIKLTINNSEYAHWKIDDIDEYSSPQYDTLYRVELKQQKQKVKLYFLPDGKKVGNVNFY